MQVVRGVFAIVMGLVAFFGYIAASPDGVPGVVSFGIGAAAAVAVTTGLELLYKRS
jgi:hypothetical protein